MNIRELRFGDIVRVADIRMLHDMDEVVHDKEWLRAEENFELYYMFRDLYRNESDHGAIQDHHLRYDITVIPANMLGSEYVKTAGHYHPEVEGTGLTYPEVYQVLEGEATYLLQKADDGVIEDIAVIEAKAGDCVLIPPGYGHITINASDEQLKMANWVCRDFSSIYEPIKELEGGGYYLLPEGFVKNLNYEEVPDLRYMEPLGCSDMGLEGGDMYDLVKDLDNLRFLTEPQDFEELFNKALNM